MSDKIEMGRCDKHGTEVPLVSQTKAEELGLPFGCQQCNNDLATSPDPTAMTRQDRADELVQLLDSPNWAGFDATWQRIDLLVGRGVMTHELAYPEYLVHEILTGIEPSIDGIIAKFPHDKPVIRVEI